MSIIHCDASTCRLPAAVVTINEADTHLLTAYLSTGLQVPTQLWSCMVQVLTVVSRHIPHAKLARSASEVAVLVGRDIAHLPMYEPLLGVLIMEILTRWVGGTCIS